MASIKQDLQYISYTLENNDNFYLTGYKVLNKQERMGLLPCKMLKYNGHIRLLYPVSKYTSVAICAENWEMADVLVYIRKLLQTVLDIRENGFIQLETVDFDVAHMFVSTSNAKLYLIALPVTRISELHRSTAWLQELKNAFITMIELSKNSDSVSLKRLKNKIIACDEILVEIPQIIDRFIREESEIFHTEQLNAVQKTDKKKVYLNLTNISKNISILIDKDEFVIGKNMSKVDGLVDVSNTISRVHCKVYRKADGCYVQDLHSSNHTYVNGRMLTADELIKIENGDILRLAEIEFSVQTAES